MAAPSTIGHYRITAKLGAGGMGEVYRALDAKLGREVAIKCLPAAFSEDPERLARLSREAQVLASLNHPNIAAIYGLEDRALVMELAEGETLAEHIAHGPVPLDEALPIIDQLIQALDYAHSRDVVHRDLKPANIKLSPEGRVKVLDFGLAKAFNTDSGAADPSSSPTRTIGLSTAGVIMGTAAYMSPEQARGHRVDRRADIWAFGVVVYEMLTGRPLFASGTVSDTLAAVLKEQPDFEAVPARMRRLLRLCLAKNPADRLRDIADARALLNEETADAVAAAPARRPTVLWGATALVALVAAILGYRLWRTPAAPPRPFMALSVDLGPDAIAGRDSTVAVSPDGSRIAYPVRYQDTTRLAVRYLGERTATPLAGTEGGFNPFFSTDGDWSGFGEAGKLYKISVRGGAPVALCDGILRGATWTPNGYIVASLGNTAGLSRIPEAGGVPQPITTPDRSKRELTHRWPQVLPDGNTVLFSANRAQANWDGARVNAVDLKTGKVQTLVEGAFYGRYSPSGHLLYIRQGTVYAEPFDPGSLRTTGPPAAVIDDVASSIYGGGQIDISRNGTLVYLHGKPGQTMTRSLVWMDRDGTSRPIIGTPDFYVSPAISPDGTRLAYVAGLSIGDVWIRDLQRNLSTKITFTGNVISVIWAPDGNHVLYGTAPGVNKGLAWMRADGAGEPQWLVNETSADSPPMFPYCVSPRGDWVVYGRAAREFAQGDVRNFDLWTLRLDNADPNHPKVVANSPILDTPAIETGGVISPDGRWIAYASDDSGKAEVFVRPFENGRISGPAKWQVSAGGGVHPLWSRHARQLLFLGGSGRIMFVDYTVDGQAFRPTQPRVWADRPIGVWATLSLGSSGPTGLRARPYDLSADGMRIAAEAPPEPDEESKKNLHVTMLVNWFDELKRRVPTGGR